MPKVRVFGREIQAENVLRVEAGTNCPQGGDTGHGGRTLIRLRNVGSTDMSVRVNGGSLQAAESVEIVLGGDAEHGTIVDALEFVLSVLKNKHGHKVSARTEDVA